MTSGFFTGDVLRGLAARVLLFLTLALLPIGIIAIVQTRAISEQSRVNAELSLIAITERATAKKQETYQDAFSAAKALSSVVRLRRANSAECSKFLAEYKRASGLYSLVAFTALDGIMACSSVGGTVDFSQSPEFQRALKNNRHHAIHSGDPKISEEPVIVLYRPVSENGETIGMMAVSVPENSLISDADIQHDITPLAILTVNRFGEVLTAEGPLEDAATELPMAFDPMLRSKKRGLVFDDVTEAGLNRLYAIVPIVENTIYAVSIWPTDAVILGSSTSTRLTSLMPIFMWIASLVVAFWALNRLALKHIRKLGRQMRRFAMDRTLPPDTFDPSVPTELVAMERTFFEMAESIMKDEATLEDSLREKNILLKEVHHRVKNNLQLISSIMNMQIRQASGPEERDVLQRLQQRILGLATVHENLYQNDSLVRVNAKNLLRGLVDQVLGLGMDTATKTEVIQTYDDVMLDPDDAAPLSLMVSEAMTNALKYVRTTGGKPGQISITLRHTGEEEAQLTVSNTATEEEHDVGTGLGSKLITAFARQLNGQIEITQSDDEYRLSVVFPVPKDGKPILDY
ncbi:sensor histidine kinase [Sulfitobacter aestuariivivens]|uniref:histidine kinase n=1 Tax=Sulfitobacter aestuariivivens TaxID=2766981 RepID=A0A927HHC0_9RHOB|nr:sensor histidine kinase [Sulfitobacter aestuariivivens]MBD3665110.1 sensor histidine kinase [Sulfitobacter aestuariivivens]